MVKIIKTSLVAAAFMTSSLIASDILATVNGKNITKQDAEAFVSATAQNAHFSQLTPAQKKMITERLIEKELFKELAQKEGIENDPEFKVALEKIKDELAVNLWMKKQLDSIVVSDSEAKEFYEKNKDKFIQKEMVQARHILVKDEKTAKEIIKELKPLKGEALQAKFIELAKEKSTGPSAPKGGELGKFSKGQMVPEFSKAVWSLKKDEITLEPVKTQFGYHIILLEDKIEAQTVPYEKVKDKIIASLKQQQFSQKVASIAKELKSKAKIVKNMAKADAAKK
ncbi:peptidylprolyl isomerase [Sulfurovum lithotrophicum]|uniref:Peptidylprolyl isomerase n=1 Tax=Sulfurovum lithotrophicum TaxID=206403 RepID=A0A7U4M0C0_9BACT|nr:peptidylprolyl isomerase [Sulfurovum lithotrophicum]AKF24477.1 peptidylprolyl isomerase [Sulfurovum lithotrophicum]